MLIPQNFAPLEIVIAKAGVQVAGWTGAEIQDGFPLDRPRLLALVTEGATQPIDVRMRVRNALRRQTRLAVAEKAVVKFGLKWLWDLPGNLPGRPEDLPNWDLIKSVPDAAAAIKGDWDVASMTGDLDRTNIEHFHRGARRVLIYEAAEIVCRTLIRLCNISEDLKPHFIFDLTNSHTTALLERHEICTVRQNVSSGIGDKLTDEYAGWWRLVQAFLKLRSGAESRCVPVIAFGPDGTRWGVRPGYWVSDNSLVTLKTGKVRGSELVPVDQNDCSLPDSPKRLEGNDAEGQYIALFREDAFQEFLATGTGRAQALKPADSSVPRITASRRKREVRIEKETRAIELLSGRYADPNCEAEKISKKDHLIFINKQMDQEFEEFEPYGPNSRAWTDRIWPAGTKQSVAAGLAGKKPNAFFQK